jgi:hypothetical protein
VLDGHHLVPVQQQQQQQQQHNPPELEDDWKDLQQPAPTSDI